MLFWCKQRKMSKTNEWEKKGENQRDHYFCINPGVHDWSHFRQRLMAVCWQWRLLWTQTVCKHYQSMCSSVQVLTDQKNAHHDAVERDLLGMHQEIKSDGMKQNKMYLVFCVCFVSDCRGTNYCLNFIFVQRQFLNMQWVDASLYCLVDFQYKHRLMSSLISAYLCFVFLSVIWKTFCFTKTLKKFKFRNNNHTKILLLCLK